MSLKGNVLKQLVKSILIPLRLTAATSGADESIHKKMFGSGHPLDLASCKTILITSNEEMNNIMKIVSLLKNLVYW